MNEGFNRIESGSVAKVGEYLTRVGRGTEMRFRRSLLLGATAVLIGCSVWVLLSASGGGVVQGKPSRQELASIRPEQAAADVMAAMPASTETSTAAELDRLRISSQSWRRGGLGSNALVTFTVRNDNDYAVKDVEIVCSFSRSDGRHLTDRRRMLPETVNMRSRKTFAHVHVGFVNVNANQAKCALASARRE